MRRYKYTPEAFTRPVKVQRVWLCVECKGRIWPGDTAYRVAGNSNTKQRQRRMCRTCHDRYERRGR